VYCGPEGSIQVPHVEAVTDFLIDEN